MKHNLTGKGVIKYLPLIAAEAHKKKPTAKSWRMDDTYIKIKGKWHYFYRAVDKHGKTLDFMLSATRDEAAAKQFFRKDQFTENGLSAFKQFAELAG